MGWRILMESSASLNPGFIKSRVTTGSLLKKEHTLLFHIAESSFLYKSLFMYISFRLVVASDLDPLAFHLNVTSGNSKLLLSPR